MPDDPTRDQATSDEAGRDETSPDETSPDETSPDETSPDETSPDAGPGQISGWTRIGRSLVRGSAGQLVLAVVVCLVTATAIWTVRERDADSSYATVRRSDLVLLLDSLTTQGNRLDSEISQLQATKTRLENGATAQKAAQQANQSRLDALNVLAGLVPATGPGIRVTILDPHQLLTAQLLLEAVQELRDAGAEAMQINQTVRVVESTWFDQSSGHLVADGTTVARPVVIDAIGDPTTLTGALQFRGGLVSSVESSQIGGTVLISRVEQVSITALHPPTPNRWAKPPS